MRLIGITGSIACGKSTVSRELLRKGYPVIDGDMLSRELTGPGGMAMNDIQAALDSISEADRLSIMEAAVNRQPAIEG